MFCEYIDSPVGVWIVQANDTGICGMSLYSKPVEGRPNEQTASARIALADYFQDKKPIVIPHLSLKGTPLQIAVWTALQHIPLGKTASYQDIAKAIGKPKAYRAVGTAIGQNPIPLIIPCHRVIRANGELGQFGLGENVKKWLLDWEAS